MAVSLGAYTYSCAYHDSAPIEPAPNREARFDVFGLNGTGKVMGGNTTRLIPVDATYRGYLTETLLASAMATDEATKGGTPGTLTVGGVSFPNSHLIAMAINKPRVDGKNGLWFAHVTYLFEQLNA